MRFICIIAVLVATSVSHAADKIKMNFNNEEITKIIENYSKASGQKFVVDPAVRGRISIFIQAPVTLDEAFNQLSNALSVNGFAISKQGDTMIVKSARNTQRDLIEVSQELPAINPTRMYTWVYKVKNLPAGNINSNVRTLQSKDGEMVVNEDTNQLIFTDWTPNLQRIASVLKEIDIPVDPAVAKHVEAAKREKELRAKNSDSNKAR